MTLFANTKNSLKKWSVANKSFIIICGLYALLTIIMTFPVAFQLRKVIYGYPGDSWLVIWTAWWRKYTFLHGLEYEYFSLSQAPFGTDMGYRIFPGPTYIMAFLALFVGELAAHNLMILGGFFLSGILTYILAYELTANRTTSFIAGLIFMFSPYAITHSRYHVELRWLLPLFMVAWFNFRRKQNVVAALWLGAAVAFNAYMHAYFAYYTVLGAATFALVEIAYDSVIYLRTSQNRSLSGWLQAALPRRRLLLYGLAIICAIILFLPELIPIVRDLKYGPPSPFRRINALVRNQTWPYVLSSRPWQFVIPAEFNPILGRFSEPAYASIRAMAEKGYTLNPPFFEEQGFFLNEGWYWTYDNPQIRPLYLGFVNLIAAIFAIWLALRRKLKEDWQVTPELLGPGLGFPVVLTLGLVALLFSLPPYLPLGGIFPGWAKPEVIVPMPSILTTVIATPLRNHTYVVPWLILSVALLAAMGLGYLLHHIRTTVGRVSITAVFIIILSVEFAHLPAHTPIDIPEEYRWLAEQPHGVIVATYPFGSQTYYQRIHEQPTLDSYAWDGNLVYDNQYQITSQALADLEQTDTVSKLAAMGVRYVVNAGERFHSTPDGLHLLFETETAQVFEVTGDPVHLVMLGTLRQGLWTSNTTWEPQVDQYRIFVWNPFNDAVSVDIDVNLAGSESPTDIDMLAWRTLTPPPSHILQSGIRIENPYIPPGYDPEPVAAEPHKTGYVFRSLVFQPGETTLVLGWSENEVVGNEMPLVEDIHFSVNE